MTEKPILINLPEATETALQDLAAQQGKTTAELIQEAIEQYLSRPNKSLPNCLGIGRSGRSDLSERVDELLWQDDETFS